MADKKGDKKVQKMHVNSGEKAGITPSSLS